MNVSVNQPLRILLGALFVSALCVTARAELDPDGTVQAVKWETDEHPITGVERIDFTVTTRQHGDFANVTRIFVELEDEEGERYIASSEGKFFDNYGDRQLTRISHFYINEGGKLKVKAYWVGFYFMDASGEHLLSSKTRKIDELSAWKESTKGCKKIAIENGSTELRPAD